MSSNKVFSPLKKSKPFNAERIYGFDCETAGKKNEFVLAVVTHKDKEYTFTDPNRLFDFFRSRKMRNAIVVATNMAFDVFAMILGSDKLKETVTYTRRGQKITDSVVEFHERNGKIYRVMIRNKADPKIMCRIVDTLNIFPASVQQLGEIINIPKMEHPSCFAQIPKNKKEEQQLIDYCANDARISEQFFRRIVIPYCNTHNITLKDTIASISMLDFRTNFLNENIPVESDQIHKLCFESYYGGRTEAFRRGTYHDITCYDVNSLYPSVLLNEYPDPERGYYCKNIRMYQILNHEGVCRCMVTAPNLHKPLLPVRMDGRLLFPVGQFYGCWTFVELRKALQLGYEINIIDDGVVYLRTKRFFADFVMEKYKERQELKKQDSPLQLMAKLGMNALYGKFGFNYRKSSSIIRPEQLTHKDIDQAERIVPFGDEFLCVEKDAVTDKPCYSFPIFASYTTAYARLKLYEYLEKYPETMYCDTDSIFLPSHIDIPTSFQLGDMKKEYNAHSAIFVRPKMYMVDDKIVCKGVPHMDQAEFMGVLTGQKVTRERFTKLRSSLRSHRSINEIYEIEKELDCQDQKREWKNRFSLSPQESAPKTVYLNSTGYHAQN